MNGVKSKVGPLCICCVVVWLVLVYGKNWGQLAQSDTAPLLLPPWQEEYWFFQLDLLCFQQLYFSVILKSISKKKIEKIFKNKIQKKISKEKT